MISLMCWEGFAVSAATFYLQDAQARYAGVGVISQVICLALLTHCHAAPHVAVSFWTPFCLLFWACFAAQRRKVHS